MNEEEKMKQVFLAFALWLGFSGASFAMQDTEPSEAQGQNSAEVKILSDKFFSCPQENTRMQSDAAYLPISMTIAIKFIN